MLKSIGYDRDNLENFLFFWSELDETDANDEEVIFKVLQIKKALISAIQFIAKRKRAWQIIVFNDNHRDVRTFLQEHIVESILDENELPYFRKIIYLYSEKQELSYRQKKQR